MKFDLPYDRERVPVEIADQNFVGSLVSKVESYRPDRSQQGVTKEDRDEDQNTSVLGSRVGYLHFWRDCSFRTEYRHGPKIRARAPGGHSTRIPGAG